MSTKTSISLDSKAIKLITEGLAQNLADTYITYLKTQNFHWNVIDSRFHSLHEMLEDFYKELAETVDEIAERIRMLKMKSPGSMREFLKLATLDEAKGEHSGDEMIRSLCHDREVIIKHLRTKIDQADKLGDAGTADMYTQHLRMHEKAAWMLRSHLNS